MRERYLHTLQYGTLGHTAVLVVTTEVVVTLGIRDVSPVVDRTGA